MKFLSGKRKHGSRVIALVLSMLLLFTTTAVSAFAADSGASSPFEYAENGDETIEITGYNGSDTDLTIPNEIDGKKVTSIGESAFESCISLENLTVSEGISTIGNYAFIGCGNLVSVTLPKSLNKIGNQAFSYCKSLVNVTLSEGLSEIGFSAFSDCLSLKEITVPKSVTVINDYAFGKYNTHMDENGNYVRDTIEGFKISGFTNTVAQRYANENGFEFISIGEIPAFEYKENGDETIEITAYYGSDSDLTIPAEIDGKKVTSIGEWAFESCTILKNLTVSEGISVIGNYAFFSCGNLVSVTLPESVTKIGLQSFAYCKSLVDLNLSEGLSEIGYSAFSDCLSLKEVTVPKSVTSIGGEAFGKYNTHSDGNGNYVRDKIEGFKILGFTNTAAQRYAKENDFEFVSIGEVSLFEYTENGDETIEITAYNGSDSDLTIPDEIDGKKVTSIGEWAFISCTTLRNLTVSKGISKIGNYAFVSCSNLVSVTLPEGLNTIGTQAFSYCRSLVDVTLPDGLTEIGFSAFSDCTSLKEITVPKSVVSIGSYAIGYSSQWDENENRYVNLKVDGFKIKGYTGTAAEDYADDNGFEFISLGGVMLGDADQNGTINIADAIMVQKHTVGILTLSGDAFAAADADKSGTVDVADAIMIQKNVIGIIDINAA